MLVGLRLWISLWQDGNLQDCFCEYRYEYIYTKKIRREAIMIITLTKDAIKKSTKPMVIKAFAP